MLDKVGAVVVAAIAMASAVTVILSVSSCIYLLLM